MLLTFAEVCERLRMSPKTLRKLITSGELVAIRTGNGATSPYRITEEALADYIRRRQVVPAKAAS